MKNKFTFRKTILLTMFISICVLLTRSTQEIQKSSWCIKYDKCFYNVLNYVFQMESWAGAENYALYFHPDTFSIHWIVNTNNTRFISSPRKISPSITNKIETQWDKFIAPSIGKVTTNQYIYLYPFIIGTGKLTFDYPSKLEQKESQIVSLEIFLDGKSKNIVDRIIGPMQTPVFNTFESKIEIPNRIRTKLKSTSFLIDPLQEDKTINFFDSKTWNWIIQAPEYPGKQVVVLSLYQEQDADPFWVSSFEIEVSNQSQNTAAAFYKADNLGVIPLTPTITPAPSITSTVTLTQTPILPPATPTQIPDVERLKNNLIDNSSAVIGAILVFIISILTIYFQFIKPNQSKRRKK